jgi:hypothetical protein
MQNWLACRDNPSLIIKENKIKRNKEEGLISIM